MTQPARILVVDDAEAEAREIKDALAGEGYLVELAATLESGTRRATQEEFDVVVTDLHLSGSGAMHLNEGLEIIRALRAAKPQVPVILVTGQPSTETTIEAMKLGAYDYILKPVDPRVFLPMIEEATVRSRFLRGPAPVAEVVHDNKHRIVGNSPAMRAVYKQLGQIAATNATVLIRGETGTGKELAARAVHHHSHRADQPFVIVNCPAIPANLLVSELFGHEPGAYTDAKARRIGQFEQASGGTLFLDEIGDMPEDAQKQLLRALQEKTIQRLGGKELIPVDVRIIAATHQDLELAIVEKRFRADLFYRINVAAVHLPPLRERREDIPDLARYFLETGAAEFGLYRPVMNSAAVEFLQHLDWQGNIRELQNVIRKTLLSCRGTITRETIQASLSPVATAPVVADATLFKRVSELLAKAKRGETRDVHAVLTAELERELYGQAIRLANGDQTQAANWLGVSRPTMREKLLRQGLHPGRET